MTSTERKLDEAKYFYRRLNIDDPYFDYNLSAFLNAARSTAWVMRHEFHKVAGWEKWFQEYNLTTQGKQLLKEINDLRIEATKKEGLKTDLFFLQSNFLVDEKYYPELQKFQNLEDGDYLLSIEPITDEPIENDEETIRIAGEISRSDKPYDGAREKLKEKCEAYLKLMDEIVQACVCSFKCKDAN
jgi:hypothetical protein